MKSKLSRIFALISFSAVLCLLTPFVLANSGEENKEETYDKLRLFAEVFSTVRNNYVEDLDDADLMTDALNGALESLDPHSHYIQRTEFVESQKSARREYGGLGIEVTLEAGLVKINYVIPDGPADKAGLVKGDFITAVEGEKVLGKTLSEAVEGMRGLEGDPIVVSVLSEGRTPRDITIIREIVQGRVVRHRVENGVGYIFIESFNHPRLSKDVEFAINDLKTSLGKQLPGLVIDVRGNPGGLVDQTVKVASHFLDGGEVFSARGRTVDNTQRYNADPGELVSGVPIVVLINSRSASAAEILAGAIQDRGRGLVMGRRSFGKGSVQSVMSLDDLAGALRLTTQRYFTPSGKSIQGRGIMPDLLVAFRQDSGETRKRFREDSFHNALINPDETDFEENLDQLDYPPQGWPDDRDYQIDRAVKLLKSPRYNNMLASRN